MVPSQAQVWPRPSLTWVLAEGMLLHVILFAGLTSSRLV